MNSIDEETKNIMQIIGIDCNQLDTIEKYIIPREILLCDEKYTIIKNKIPLLKKKYSSSFLTSLQKNANTNQKWPLINFVRQILNTYGYQMTPFRKADGYTLDGIKKYKRYFQICRKISIVNTT